MDFIKRKEWWFWIISLALLAFLPFGEGQSLCLSHFIGWDHCPGCGLGMGIHHVLNGRWSEAWAEHYLSIPSTAIIIGRCISMIRTSTSLKTSYEPYS